MVLARDEPVAVAATDAVQRGDAEALRSPWRDHPGLTGAEIGDEGDVGMRRSLLHAATDWPGHDPHPSLSSAR